MCVFPRAQINLSYSITISVVCLLGRIHSHCLLLVFLALFPLLTPLAFLRRYIHQKLSNINVSKSPGPDGWPPTGIVDFISLPLFLIFTKSLEHGVVPSSWKRGYVTPIFNKGAQSAPKLLPYYFNVYSG